MNPGVIGPVDETYRSREHNRSHSFAATVAIPFANARRTIADTIASIRDQMADCELLLVPNGVTDDSVEIAIGASAGIATRVLRCESHGYDSNARNAAVQYAMADKVLFLDADDVAAPGYVVMMREALELSPVVTADWEVGLLNPWVGGERRVGLPFPATEKNYEWTYAPAGTLGVQRRLFHDIGGFRHDLYYAADNEWCFRACKTGHVIERAPGAVVHYRLRPGLAAHFKQRFGWGIWEVAARKQAEADGLPPKRNDLRRWNQIFWSAKGARTADDRYKVAGNLGQALGHIVGSLRFRKLDL